MASTRLSAPPTCLSCLRRLAQPSSPSGFPLLRPLAQQQTRGAKMTKAEQEDTQGIPVRLLRDMPGFGPKEAIIRVLPGRMRNQWFPNGQAEYMTKKRFEELQLTEAAIGTRDRTYGDLLTAEERGEKRGKRWQNKRRPVTSEKRETLVLTPQQSLALLQEHIPKTVTFARKTIQPTAPPPSAVEPTAPRSPSLSRHAQTSTSAGVPEPKSAEPAQISIFGSVSATDILAAIKEKLLESDPAKGGRVALEASGITITGLEAGEDRIKHLGTFDVLISVSPELDPIELKVNVVAEE
ncbi:hypothetical protein F4805DRAFT_417466 [Annulohypoxylon moriforme]|nr:hypothetical protein F4805DRAFT_417466 [Annulohypoxylon moriforme]